MQVTDELIRSVVQEVLSHVKNGDYVSLLVYAVGAQGQTSATRVVSLHVGA